MNYKNNQHAFKIVEAENNESFYGHITIFNES